MQIFDVLIAFGTDGAIILIGNVRLSFRRRHEVKPHLHLEESFLRP